jgi:radical SAM protein with 4Fe4S-binding SPASM domain
MTPSEFSLILDKLKGLTEYIYLHVMGEPMTHPELCDFIKLATSRGFKCAITTNGTLLKSRGDELFNSGVYKVNISVHSFETGSREDYLSYVNSCISFADEASRRGILTVLRLWNKGYDGGLNDRTLEILKTRLQGEWKWGSRGARIRHKLHLEYGDRFDWPDMGAENMGNEVFCYGLGDHFGILVDGSVIPCCLDREGAITLGNIHEAELSEILESRRAQAIRNGFQKREVAEELCRKCGYARRF